MARDVPSLREQEGWGGTGREPFLGERGAFRVSRAAHPSPHCVLCRGYPPALRLWRGRGSASCPQGPLSRQTSVFPLRPSAVPDLPHFSWRDGAGPACAPPLSLPSPFLSPRDLSQRGTSRCQQQDEMGVWARFCHKAVGRADVQLRLSGCWHTRAHTQVGKELFGLSITQFWSPCCHSGPFENPLDLRQLKGFSGQTRRLALVRPQGPAGLSCGY